MSSNELKDAELLVRTLILISRNFSNISSVAAADYVHLIISIASSVMLKVIIECIFMSSDLFVYNVHKFTLDCQQRDRRNVE